MVAPAIQVSELTKRYGPVLAVDHISFEVAPGELVGFLGNNGAGKTTTMRILTTYMPATEGLAQVAGHDVMYESMEVRKKLGYLPESVPLYPEMRVDEYLLTRAKLKGIERTKRNARIDYCVDRCRIKEVRSRLIGSLSKGYRQRVGLADAMIADPEVLIMDEPLSGLDPIQQEETLATIKNLAGQHTVLFSSHHLPDVEKICDRVMIIHRGRIRFDDRLSRLSQEAPILIVEVHAAEADAKALFQSVKGIKEIHHQPLDAGWLEWQLHTQAGHDPREQVAKQVLAKGWGLRRLEQRRERLADTFMKVSMQS